VANRVLAGQFARKTQHVLGAIGSYLDQRVAARLPSTVLTAFRRF